MLSTKLTATSGVRVTPFSSSAARRCARQTGSLSQPSWVTRGGSYLVEVEVGEVEPEDVAIQRFQRAVTQTLVINELRRRRRVMTKIEALQAKQNEKGLIKKLNVDPPSWKDTYGDGMDPAPFTEYFQGDNDYADIAANSDVINDDLLFMDTADPNAAYGSNMYSGPSGYMTGNFGGQYSTFGGQYSQQYNYQQTDYNYPGAQQVSYDQAGYATQQGNYADPQTTYQQVGYDSQGYTQQDNTYYNTPAQTGYPQEGYPQQAGYTQEAYPQQAGYAQQAYPQQQEYPQEAYPQEGYPPAQGGEPQAPAGY